jgi:hypothetical protein
VTDVFTAPDDGGDLKSSDFSTSMVDRLGAQWADTLDPKNSLSGMWLARQARQSNAAGTDQAVGAGGDIDVFSGQSLEDRQAAIDARVNAIPDISQGDAKDLLKQEGLTEQDVHLGDAPSHKMPVLKTQIDEAHTRRDRAAAIERGPQGFFPDALGAVTSIGVGMIDPVNAAAFSIPVIGEARMGKIIASAGDSIVARGAARFGQGAAQGAVGTAVLQPADWWLHTRDGQDYTMAQAMESIVMGAGMGGAFHAAGGLFGDLRSRWRGEPLAGSPQDLLLRGLMTGTHIHADQLAEGGVPLEEVPGIASAAAAEPKATEAAPQSNEDIEGLINKVEGQLLPAEPVHPAEALADLPPAACEDAVHAAMADIISGRPTQAAEMLNIAADHDPRIAESLEAYHGSPHDFDRFNVGKIGEGEGQQSFGHGLYFAENEGIARGYRERLSRENPPLSAKALADPVLGPRIKEATTEYDRLNAELADAANSHDEARISQVQHELSGAHRYLEAVHREANEKYPPGALYKVRLTADRSKLLDWDKEIGDQPHLIKMLDDHPELRQALEDDLDDHMMSTDLDVYTGRELYHMLRRHASEGALPGDEGLGGDDNKEVGEFLKRAGLHGVQYLDAGSRKAGEGTRNYVIFDDKHIEITHKNGEPVKREDLVAEHQMQTAKAKGLRGRAAADPRTWSLFEYLASKGGLRPDPELRAIFGNDRGPFVPGFGPLIRKSGATLDEALTHAKEGGYLIDANDLQHVAHTDLTAAQMGQEATLAPRDLLDHIDNENRGQKQYRADHIEATKYDPEQEKHVIMGALEHELESHGASVSDIDPKLLDRAVEIVHREGVSDVMEAYERAIMEDEERYNATAEALRTDPDTRDIPGWNAAPDAGAASGDRGRNLEDSGQAGRSDGGAREADGQEPARAGQAGRSSPAEVAADPRWRALADTTPDYNDPEVLAESEAAARLPEPDSVQPAKSLSALERAAADAEEVWRQLEPMLTEQERAQVTNAMDQIKLDAEARSRIITDGVTCLAGAIG